MTFAHEFLEPKLAGPPSRKQPRLSRDPDVGDRAKAAEAEAAAGAAADGGSEPPSASLSRPPLLHSLARFYSPSSLPSLFFFSSLLFLKFRLPPSPFSLPSSLILFSPSLSLTPNSLTFPRPFRSLPHLLSSSHPSHSLRITLHHLPPVSSPTLYNEPLLPLHNEGLGKKKSLSAVTNIFRNFVFAGNPAFNELREGLFARNLPR